jgi:hypothetical protein
MSQVTTKQLRDELCHELRHGGYVRCTGYLRGPGRLACVLGVAVDVYMRHYGDLEVGKGFELDRYLFDGAMSHLPERVRKAFGFTTSLGAFTDACGDDEDSIADLSDNGMPFHQIADLIESNPPGLFIDSPPPEPAEVMWGDHDSARATMLRMSGAYSPSQDDAGDYAATMERDDRFATE